MGVAVGVGEGGGVGLGVSVGGKVAVGVAVGGPNARLGKRPSRAMTAAVPAAPINTPTTIRSKIRPFWCAPRNRCPGVSAMRGMITQPPDQSPPHAGRTNSVPDEYIKDIRPEWPSAYLRPRTVLEERPK